jgi:very-short-patch-repair endonuclease
MSPPERLLLQHLRLRPGGVKFRRQHPVGPYVVDFACLASRLAIEIDGAAHDTGVRAQSDQIKSQFLKDNGYRVLRVAAARVMGDAVAAANAIVALAASPLHRPADGPPPRAGED